MKNAPESMEGFAPGAVLAYSWGYDQTNVDFYEVLERRGKYTVILRQLEADKVEDSHLAMQGRTRPNVPHVYRGPAFAKRVTRGWNGGASVGMDHGIATPVDPAKPQRCSWYA